MIGRIKRLLRPPEPEFGSWREVCDAARQSYEDDLLTRFRVERSAGRVADGTLLRGSLLNLVARLVNKIDLTITDFGGATGDLGGEFQAVFQASRYCVVETTALVAAMQNRQPAGVVFASEIPAQCSVFYSSGTIQYLPDPIERIRRGFASAEHAVVLVRNCFSKRERFTIQRSRLFDNGSGPVPSGWTDTEIVYPHRTLVEGRILEVAQASDFELCSRLEEHSGAVVPDSYGCQLTFWRRAKTWCA